MTAATPTTIPNMDEEITTTVLPQESMHPDTRQLGDEDREAGRFAEVGAMMLNFTIVDTLFKLHPLQTAETLRVRR